MSLAHLTKLLSSQDNFRKVIFTSLLFLPDYSYSYNQTKPFDIMTFTMSLELNHTRDIVGGPLICKIY